MKILKIHFLLLLLALFTFFNSCEKVTEKIVERVVYENSNNSSNINENNNTNNNNNVNQNTNNNQNLITENQAKESLDNLSNSLLNLSKDTKELSYIDELNELKKVIDEFKVKHPNYNVQNLLD